MSDAVGDCERNSLPTNGHDAGLSSALGMEKQPSGKNSTKSTNKTNERTNARTLYPYALVICGLCFFFLSRSRVRKGECSK